MIGMTEITTTNQNKENNEPDTPKLETVFKKKQEERRLIKQETRLTIKLSIILVISVLCMGAIAYLSKPGVKMGENALQETWKIFNIVVIMMMVVILAVRKTIYYSPRFIKEEFSLTQVLRKWRQLDITLLAFAEIIPIIGLVASYLGMPFSRTYHFFVASLLLMVILMPIGLKVRSKLTVLRQYRDKD